MLERNTSGEKHPSTHWAKNRRGQLRCCALALLLRVAWCMMLLLRRCLCSRHAQCWVTTKVCHGTCFRRQWPWTANSGPGDAMQRRRSAAQAHCAVLDRGRYRNGFFFPAQRARSDKASSPRLAVASCSGVSTPCKQFALQAEPAQLVKSQPRSQTPGAAAQAHGVQDVAGSGSSPAKFAFRLPLQ